MAWMIAGSSKDSSGLSGDTVTHSEMMAPSLLLTTA